MWHFPSKCPNCYIITSSEATTHSPYFLGWLWDFLWNNDKFVGIFDLRHSLTDYLKKEGGNIAYYIVPSSRRQGFASGGLKLCCKYAREILGLEKVLVTCNAENIASYKTMKKVMSEFGGFEDEPIQFTNKEEKRVWINTMLAKWKKILTIYIVFFNNRFDQKYFFCHLFIYNTFGV